MPLAENRRVGVMGTGATGIQVIAEIADQRGRALYVFQRRPNWSTPLNNSSDLGRGDGGDPRALRRDLRPTCAVTNGGFDHLPDRRGFWNVTPEERRALGRALRDAGLRDPRGNFPEIYLDEAANRELSDYVADRIRGRVDDPVRSPRS